MFRFLCLSFFKLRIKSIFYSFLFIFLCFYLLTLFGNYTKEHSPVITWWTASLPSNDRLITCYQNKYTCIITYNKTQSTDTNVFLFYGSEIDHEFPSRHVPWAIFHEESPKNYAPFLYDYVQNLFNLSSTFSRHSDFPVTLQYLEKLDLIVDTQYYIPVEEKNALLNHTAPVLYIQSDCDTPIDRDSIVQTLGNFIDIDSYGVCLQNKTFPKELSNIYSLDLYNERFLKFIARYKFIISIENAICDDYITEKLWRPLIVGSIPIYLGSPSVQDWLPNNNSAILLQNYENIQELVNVILQINNNDTLYNSYMRHKIHRKVQNELLKAKLRQGRFGLETDQEFPITAFECFVCRQVHENNWPERRFESIYNCPNPKSHNWTSQKNTWDQHWTVGRCQARALQFLLATNRPYTEKQFKDTWEYYLKHNEC